MNFLAGKILSSGIARKIAHLVLGKGGKPLYTGLVFHSETVQDERVFKRLMELGAGLAFRPTLCVMTPRNPYIKDDMAMRNVSETEFGRRLGELKKYYDVGLHGHWCKKGKAPAPYNERVPTKIEEAGYTLTLEDPREIENQFKAEYDYLKEYGFQPRVYTAGWWFLSGTVVWLLDKYGFELDCSLRYGYADTFGGYYVSPAEMPRQGRLFPLKPSSKVMECASIFYANANWWTLAKELYPILASTDGPFAAVLPLHDYDLLEDFQKVKDNIAFIARLKNVRWTNLSGLAGMFSGFNRPAAKK